MRLLLIASLYALAHGSVKIRMGSFFAAFLGFSVAAALGASVGVGIISSAVGAKLGFSSTVLVQCFHQIAF